MPTLRVATYFLTIYAIPLTATLATYLTLGHSFTLALALGNLTGGFSVLMGMEALSCDRVMQLVAGRAREDEPQEWKTVTGVGQRRWFDKAPLN
jgi:hypothetical protein